MSATPTPAGEGARLYEELLAVHGIMRRGTALVAGSFDRLAAGGGTDPGALVATTRWLVGFVHHHHQSEDELLWPVLRALFPGAVAELDRLTGEHETLGAELEVLAASAEALAASSAAKDASGAAGASAARAGLPAARQVHAILAAHLDAEEPVLGELFPRVPDADITRLRKAVVDGAPRTGPHLVLGLMEDPEPVPGFTAMRANLPAPLRWARPLLLSRYRATRRALGGSLS